MRLKDKVCVITGSSRGIGLAIAKAFAFEGAKVTIVGTTLASANEAAKEIKKENPQAQLMSVSIDVSSSLSIAEGFKKIYTQFGKIDVLVNNAGITLTKPIEEVTDIEYDKLMAIDASGVYKCIREVLKYMPKDGSIINTSSMNGVYGAKWQSLYSGAKAAVIGFTKSLAKELGERNIRVNAIAPGVVDTEMVKKFVTDAKRQALISMTPLKRVAQPEDLAGLYIFLASEESSFITGTVIGIDGGLVM